MLPCVRSTLLRAAVPAVLALLAVAPGALADARTGGAAAPEAAAPPTGKAVLRKGRAIAPAGAPLRVRRAIRAANRIVGKPYRYGGGHARVEDTGYDCSGTISYALIGARLLRAPLDSSGFMSWGEAGRGRWITVYTNPGHAFVEIAGLRLDTSAAGERRSSGKGPRWRRGLRTRAGFEARHPAGL